MSKDDYICNLSQAESRLRSEISYMEDNVLNDINLLDIFVASVAIERERRRRNG